MDCAIFCLILYLITNMVVVANYHLALDSGVIGIGKCVDIICCLV